MIRSMIISITTLTHLTTLSPLPTSTIPSPSPIPPTRITIRCSSSSSLPCNPIMMMFVTTTISKTIFTKMLKITVTITKMTTMMTTTTKPFLESECVCEIQDYEEYYYDFCYLHVINYIFFHFEFKYKFFFFFNYLNFFFICLLFKFFFICLLFKFFFEFLVIQIFLIN